jgi:hypothetical protein
LASVDEVATPVVGALEASNYASHIDIKLFNALFELNRKTNDIPFSIIDGISNLIAPFTHKNDFIYIVKLSEYFFIFQNFDGAQILEETRHEFLVNLVLECVEAVFDYRVPLPEHEELLELVDEPVEKEFFNELQL